MYRNTQLGPAAHATVEARPRMPRTDFTASTRCPLPRLVTGMANKTRGKCRAFDNPDLAGQRSADAPAGPPGREVLGACVVDAVARKQRSRTCDSRSLVTGRREEPVGAAAARGSTGSRPLPAGRSVDAPAPEPEIVGGRVVGALKQRGPSRYGSESWTAGRRRGRTPARSHVATGRGGAGAGGAGLKRDDAAETLREEEY
ncbi:hypothetical protein THAOC_20969 [Thalassiosira oceanica]|uniref:Uncharacterized protein n=1 Tax=Thalassiosira oceanica TaxID=159749 RepID=K0S0L3_THAOC|nr:hypothetical protein THAOC_20969 [Thalassiosira oceanica]|eukprot:EJK58870.1 hypothetical protein THAOC_20969 [Thalassiosira oceanica]